ncbi:Putative osmoprotectant uptake system substrate-binding protein osmF [Beauveria bassiana D1-5]|uniref:Putative osmoprotectant uptake system substrate-binding protein osmF n=1 Tax=Beauveria bassiana D1-5 TaxID=1245745 RepID=A0A0A2VUN4_BEABA|nr:Putative osmoprotectant uptake system substrate-binding protein osmF [Beauveria bassiana D1-5]
MLATGAQAAEPVKVGSKIDTEGSLLGNIILQVLESHDVKTVNKVQLGTTPVVRGAITSGELDIYPEYTGNGAFFFKTENDPAWKDAQKGYEKVKQLDYDKNHLVWLTPAPANNTYTIAVRKDLAEKNHLVSLADLSEYLKKGGTFKLAASAEFIERSDALPAFEKAYGFKLEQSQLLSLAGGDTAVTIKAAAQQTSGVNAAMAYGTDGPVAALGLETLTDPKGVQAVSAPTAVVREAVLKEYPQIGDWLKPVFTSLDQKTLQQLNAKIAVEACWRRVLVLLPLVLLLAAAWMLLPIINNAPNRLVSGEPLGITQLPGTLHYWLALPFLMLAGLTLAPGRALTQLVIIAIGELLFIGLLLLLGHIASQFALEGSSLARTSPGSGLWLMLAVCLLLCADAANRLTANPLWRLLLNLQIWIVPVVLLATGYFSDLSLMKEYVNRQDVFDDALSHCALRGAVRAAYCAPGRPCRLAAVARENRRERDWRRACANCAGALCAIAAGARRSGGFAAGATQHCGKRAGHGHVAGANFLASGSPAGVAGAAAQLTGGLCADYRDGRYRRADWCGRIWLDYFPGAVEQRAGFGSAWRDAGYRPGGDRRRAI